MFRVENTTYLNFREAQEYIEESPTVLPDIQTLEEIANEIYPAAQLAKVPFLKLSGGDYVFQDIAADMLRLLSVEYEDQLCVWLTIPIPPFAPPVVPDPQELQAECYAFFKRFFARLWKTYDKYSTILGYYASEKAKLMEGVANETHVTTKFNDTPQVASVGDTDPYMTNHTRVDGEGSDMRETPIDRLDGIQRKYDAMLGRWVHEFAGMFILEANIL